MDSLGETFVHCSHYTTRRGYCCFCGAVPVTRKVPDEIAPAVYPDEIFCSMAKVQLPTGSEIDCRAEGN